MGKGLVIVFGSFESGSNFIEDIRDFGSVLEVILGGDSVWKF